MLTWKEITGLYLGGAFCLPLILLGFQSGATYGLGGSTMMIFLGNWLLMILAMFTSRLGILTRKTTAELVEERIGGGILSIAMISIHLLWFALQLDLMGSCLLGGLSIFCVITGIKKLSIIANLSLPLLMGVLIYSIIQAPVPLLHIGLKMKHLMSFGVFIAAGLAATIEMPTYFKKVRSLSDGRIACVLIFGIGVPLIEIGGAYLGASGAPLFNSWSTLFLVIAGVTTNNNNLYAASVYGERLLGKRSVLVLGLIGSALMFLHPGKNIQTFLPYMAIPLGSIGGVLLARGSIHSLITGLACGLIGPLPMVSALIGSMVFALGEQYVNARQS